MKLRRDVLVLAGLFVVLIGFIFISPKLRPPEVPSSIPTTRSSNETGTMALFRWLSDSGYDARRLEYRGFDLSDDDAALFMLNPREEITNSDATTVLDWVERGGTLILADDESVTFSPSNALLDELDVWFDVYTTTQTLELPIQEVEPKQPALEAPLTENVLARTGRVVLAPNRNDVVELLGTEDATVLAGIKYGRGYIYLSAATYPFTNMGLREPGNAALVLNMLRRVPSGGRIQFDEYHLGFRTPPSTPSMVLGSPLGWAVVYAALVTGLYLVLSGRRFGRPVPLASETALRSSAEYVTSMADLFQRGSKRDYIAEHYYVAFKRRLGKRDAVSSHFDDNAFARELARNRPLDPAMLTELLGRLKRPTDEAALLRAINDAENLFRATN